MTVYRIQNPAAFAMPAIVKLLYEAFRQTYDQDGAVAAIHELGARIFDPSLGVFVGTNDDGVPVSLVIIAPPHHPKHSPPQAITVYNVGPDDVRDAVTARGAEFVRSLGYDRLWCINQTGRSDAAHARLFKGIGEARQVGTILEYRLTA